MTHRTEGWRGVFVEAGTWGFVTNLSPPEESRPEILHLNTLLILLFFKCTLRRIFFTEDYSCSNTHLSFRFFYPPKNLGFLLFVSKTLVSAIYDLSPVFFLIFLRRFGPPATWLDPLQPEYVKTPNCSKIPPPHCKIFHRIFSLEIQSWILLVQICSKSNRLKPFKIKSVSEIKSCISPVANHDPPCRPHPSLAPSPPCRVSPSLPTAPAQSQAIASARSRATASARCLASRPWCNYFLPLIK